MITMTKAKTATIDPMILFFKRAPSLNSSFDLFVLIPARRVWLTPHIHRVAGNRQNNGPAIVVELACLVSRASGARRSPGSGMPRNVADLTFFGISLDDALGNSPVAEQSLTACRIHSALHDLPGPGVTTPALRRAPYRPSGISRRLQGCRRPDKASVRVRVQDAERGRNGSMRRWRPPVRRSGRSRCRVRSPLRSPHSPPAKPPSPHPREPVLPRPPRD